MVSPAVVPGRKRKKDDVSDAEEEGAAAAAAAAPAAADHVESSSSLDDEEEEEEEAASPVAAASYARVRKMVVVTDRGGEILVCRRCHLGNTYKKGHALDCPKSAHYDQQSTAAGGKRANGEGGAAAPSSAAAARPSPAVPYDRVRKMVVVSDRGREVLVCRRCHLGNTFKKGHALDCPKSAAHCDVSGGQQLANVKGGSRKKKKKRSQH